jgi:hypothetical protein
MYGYLNHSIGGGALAFVIFKSNTSGVVNAATCKIEPRRWTDQEEQKAEYIARLAGEDEALKLCQLLNR